jgi:hypothetical protein
MAGTESVYNGAGILGWRNSTYSPANSMWYDCPLREISQDPSIAFVWREDFKNFTTAYDGLTNTLTDSGACAMVASTHGGVIQLEPSDGTVTDNDEGYLGSTTALIVPTSARTIWLEARCKFTEANTDDANIGIGFSSTYAANALQDNGAGPAANYYGAMFFKVDGGTTWSCEVSNAASQTTNAGVATRTSGSFVRYGIKLEGLSLATFYIDGVAVSSCASNLPTAAMGIFFGVKNGDTNEEALQIDWFKLVMIG